VRIELPTSWIIALNCIGWPVIQLGLAWLFTRLPATCFRPPASNSIEPWLYDRVFHVKSWKDRLPDAATWFSGGFAKRSLSEKSSGYLERFIQETWRGELCHWCALCFVPFFFLWNPWWANLLILFYALAANLPCILAQRYNRIRLQMLLDRLSSKAK
jgi:glycosyl-4,4'-diaponeurosporenoate acyltransferase